MPGSTLTPMPIDQLTVPLHNNFSHALGSSDITINTAGHYRFAVDTCIENQTGNNRSIAETWLYIDAGSGFNLVTGTGDGSYHRNATRGKTSATLNIILQLNAGDVIRAASQRTGGTSTLRFVANMCRMIIESKAGPC